MHGLTNSKLRIRFCQIHHDRSQHPPLWTSDRCNPKFLPLLSPSPPKKIAAIPAVLMKIQVFWDFAFCRLVNIYGIACWLLAFISKVFEVRYDYINVVFSNRQCVVSQKA